MKLPADAIRTLQTRFPRAVDAKYAVQRTVRRAFRRPFEPEFQVLRALGIEAGSLAVDVGANRGQSIDAIGLLRPDMRILAIEPNDRLARRLERGYVGRSNRIEVRCLGLSDEEGMMRLFVPSYNGYEFDGLASLDYASAASWLEDRLLGFDRRKLHIRAIDVEVSTLDLLGVEPAFLKVDVQGLESRVVRGGIETLERCRPALLIETPGAELATLLAGLGYQACRFEGGRITIGELGRVNTIFVHESRLD